MDRLVAVGVGILVFTSTNIDDLFLLLAFFSDPAFAPRQVIVGQYVGIATLVLASLICSLAALIVPSAYLGLLGLSLSGSVCARWEHHGQAKQLRKWRGSNTNGVCLACGCLPCPQ
jgi:cadmium resistance protein CadD (predicted permease)